MLVAVLLGVAPVVLAGCGGGAGVALTIVPSVVGLKEAQATQQIVTADGLRLHVVRASSNTVPAGAVAVQSPIANSTVNPGSYVTITVSAGRSMQNQRQLAASPAAAVVTAYLNAVQVGDCAKAERYTRPTFFDGNGNLCVGSAPGPIRFDNWRSTPDLPPAHPGKGDYEYGVELHVTALGPAAGGIGSLGWHTWFLEAKNGPGGYKLEGGGSGP